MAIGFAQADALTMRRFFSASASGIRLSARWPFPSAAHQSTIAGARI
ncbi:hypothetical protein HMPREF0004_3809 [Achromobacter piechaudii ATCC 43553]|uniref:Uncharacterized protein n=1 Tax=Achromobacter piechaudii ATCC 43553 TaxID=742159 RepID=D4XEB2_9BURK|nr:hypothetical protein HMPREF0004_3809 [Achromobacter piechaudii ATCC 43553]